MSIIPWSPTKMMLTQRCSFICLSPSMNWPTILSISLRGLFNWNTQEESRITYSVLPWHRRVKSTRYGRRKHMTHICVHGSHFVSICVWLFGVHGVNIRPGSRQTPGRQDHMHICGSRWYFHITYIKISHFINFILQTALIQIWIFTSNAALSMLHDQDLSLFFSCEKIASLT